MMVCCLSKRGKCRWIPRRARKLAHIRTPMPGPTQVSAHQDTGVKALEEALSRTPRPMQVSAHQDTDVSQRDGAIILRRSDRQARRPALRWDPSRHSAVPVLGCASAEVSRNSTSSRVEMRPRIALRWGKRPKRRMTLRYLAVCSRAIAPNVRYSSGTFAANLVANPATRSCSLRSSARGPWASRGTCTRRSLVRVRCPDRTLRRQRLCMGITGVGARIVGKTVRVI
jgi:hypothetical protein